jgi:hypothetical protein
MLTNVGEYDNYPNSFQLFDEEDEESFLNIESLLEIDSCIWQIIDSILPLVFRSFAASFLKSMVLVFTSGLFVIF